MGQCLCSWCVEARQRNRPEIPDSSRDAEAPDLRDLAAYDQARTWDRYWDEQFARDAERREGARRARHAAIASRRAQVMRAARERAGASCP